jgi:DNA-directed RNA polymerase subunit RPC12/RpoP
MNAFTCPQCGASLEFERINSPTIQCRYCNSLVIVPAELRPVLPPRTEPLTSYRGEPTNKLIPALIVVAVLVGGIGILVAVFSRSSNTNGSSNTNRTVSALPPYTPRLAPTPTPAPKSDGYTVAFTFGSEGTGPSFFKDEMCVAVDGSGLIYISDETRRVQVFDSSGQFLKTWNIPTQTKWYARLKDGPRKLMANSSGDLFAVLAGVVLKLDGATGEALGAAHGSDYIHDAALLPDSSLVIMSQKGDDDELVLIGSDGRAAHRTHRFVSSLLDKQLEVGALRVAVDGTGETFALYALGGVNGEHWYDDEDLAVFKFSPEGKYVSRFGGGGHEPGQFGVPSGLAVDNLSRVYVREMFDKIHVYAADGRFLKTLKAPHAVEAMTFDSQNNLYVAGNHKVSKLLLDN